jgi:hypothetical protein
MSTQEGGGRIRTSDLHFMKSGPQPIELPLGTKGKKDYKENPILKKPHKIRILSMNIT